VVRLLRARRSLLIENLALRHQLAATKRRHPRSQLGRRNERQSGLRKRRFRGEIWDLTPGYGKSGT
jgi:hypothetical protein